MFNQKYHFQAAPDRGQNKYRKQDYLQLSFQIRIIN